MRVTHGYRCPDRPRVDAFSCGLTFRVSRQRRRAKPAGAGRLDAMVRPLCLEAYGARFAQTLKGLEPFQNFAELRRARRRRTGF